MAAHVSRGEGYIQMPSEKVVDQAELGRRERGVL